MSEKQDGNVMTERQEIEMWFYEKYIELVYGKMNELETKLKQIEETIEQLVADGRIEPSTQVVARIKSPESALKKMKAVKIKEKNQGEITDKTRGTYDIYALSILCEKTEDLATIKAALIEKGLRIENEKQINDETRGYQAEHFNFAIDTQEQLKVECHMLTFEANKKMYPHLYYKVLQEKQGGFINGGRLTEEEEAAAKTETINKYIRGELMGIDLGQGKTYAQKSNVPQIWEAKLDDNGKMQRRKLSDDEAIRLAFYPALEGVRKPELEAR